jgi:hypothetical protein
VVVFNTYASFMTFPFELTPNMTNRESLP